MPNRPTEPPSPILRPPKPGFSRYNVSGEARTLPPCGHIRVYSIATTLTLSFNDGDAVPCMSGDRFSAGFLGQFDKVTAEGSAVLIIGFGTSESPGAVTRYDETTGGFYVQTSTGEVQLIL